MPQGAMKSVEAHRFAMVPRSDVPRSAFDVNHVHKTTFGVSGLIPVYVQEVLPGDSIRCRMHAFARLAPVIVPVMDNLILESFFFFVPNRLVWDNWQRMMGEQDSPTDYTSYLVPQVSPDQTWLVPGTLYDYMGITLNGAVGSVGVSALPFRAYNLIWNEWFRDEDLQLKLPEHRDDGPDPVASYDIAFRGKRHDYFTSARPWPQKPTRAQQTVSLMDPQGPGLRFQIPLQGNTRVPQIGAPVSGIGITPGTVPVGPHDVYEAMRFIGQTYDKNVATNTTGAIRVRTSGTGEYPDVKVLINDLRQANAIQRMLELNQRGGTRYSELIRSHFGVISPDARLQRPEYLGGGRSFVQIHPVAQTSGTGATGTTTLLGEQSGIGTLQVYNHGFSQSFTEHGFIIGLVNVRADLTYQQGIRRMWLRRTQFDHYWPALAHLGEQAVRSSEIYADASSGDDDIFGYQERWAEYKWQPSRTSGYFRSTVPTPLDMWHFGQKFAARPLLNSNFMIDLPPVERALQVSGWHDQQFLMDALFEERMVRAMPMYSIPGLGARL